MKTMKGKTQNDATGAKGPEEGAFFHGAEAAAPDELLQLAAAVVLSSSRPPVLPSSFDESGKNIRGGNRKLRGNQKRANQKTTN